MKKNISYIPEAWLKNKVVNHCAYPEDMDEEMVPFMDVLNSIPGVRTMFSCCGHAKFDNGMYFVLNFASDQAQELVVNALSATKDFPRIEQFMLDFNTSKVPEYAVGFYPVGGGKAKKVRIAYYRKWVKALLELLPNTHWRVPKNYRKAK